MKKLTGIYILVAAALWGCIGLFVNALSALSFSRIQIVGVRMFFAVLTMLPVMLFLGKDGFKIRLKDIWCFAGTGFVSLLLFNICYFYSMQYNSSLSVAAILLYTAPAFVMLISVPLFKEKLTVKKLISLVLMTAGCVFVSGVFSGGAVFSLKGIVFGIGSGLGYALYSIFGRFAINRGYRSATISFYTFVFALLGSFVFCDMPSALSLVFSGSRAIFLSIGIGFVCCVLPYIFYTKGLEGTDNSTASIIATAEPMLASVVGITVFKDRVSVWLILGIALMISGIIIMNIHFDRKETHNEKNRTS